MPRWIVVLAGVTAAPALAGEPLVFEEKPLVVSVPKPQVEIVLPRQELMERYNAQVERGLTDRILAMEKEQQLQEPANRR